MGGFVVVAAFYCKLVRQIRKHVEKFPPVVVSVMALSELQTPTEFFGALSSRATFGGQR